MDSLLLTYHVPGFLPDYGTVGSKKWSICPCRANSLVSEAEGKQTKNCANRYTLAKFKEEEGLTESIYQRDLPHLTVREGAAGELPDELRSED